MSGHGAMSPAAPSGTLRSGTWPMPTFFPRVIGNRHMAAATHYLAAQASFQILEAGGNAVDAGVAGGIVLGVVQCEFVHFAGVAPLIVHLAERRETWTVTGLGAWPQLATAEYFRRQHGGAIPPGILRAVVPGAPDAWLTALERWGTMSFGEVAHAAIGFAREGFPLSEFSSAMYSAVQPGLARHAENARHFLRNGAVPDYGTPIVQKDLAATLGYLAAEERAAAHRGGRIAGIAAARAAFYRGDVATAIDRYHREHGGWLRYDDLAGFRVDVEPAVCVRFRDLDVYTCGAWCQGPVLAQALCLLRPHDLEALGHNTPAYVHLLAEALKLAFADREKYYGDPKFVEVPLAALLSEPYAAMRRQEIDLARACPGMPAAGPAAALDLPARPMPMPRAGALPPEASLPPAPGNRPQDPQLDTAHLGVVDRNGNAFSSTPSDGCSGGPMIPGTGLVPSARGLQSRTDPRHPACLAPGKRPRLTPSPAIAIQGDRTTMPFGSPGNDVQPQAMLQVLLNIFVWRMPPQTAVEQPRFASSSFPNSSEPHDYHPARLDLELRFPESTGMHLQAFGHDVHWWEPHDWRAGAVSAIVHDRLTGLLEGAADRRRPGGVCGC